MNGIAFKYDESKVPITGYTPVFDEKGNQIDSIAQRGVLDGVAMCDMTLDYYLKLPKRMQRAVFDVPYFVPASAAANLPDPNAPEPEGAAEPIVATVTESDDTLPKKKK